MGNTQCALATLVGVLQYHPIKRYTQRGVAVVNLSVKSEWEKDGRKIFTTQKAVLWGEDAENFIESQPNKDDLVEVTGNLRNKKTEKNGVEVWETEVVGSARLLEKNSPAADDAQETGKDLPF